MFGASVIRRAFPWIWTPGIPSNRSTNARGASETRSSPVRTETAAGVVRSGASERVAVTTTVSAKRSAGSRASSSSCSPSTDAGDASGSSSGSG